MNYNFLFQLLNESGFNVFFFILPYHFQRKPAASLFSGEFYWSADLLRSRSAAKQGIFDLGTAVRILKQVSPFPTVLVGFSMGGNLTLRYFMLEDLVNGLFLINPVTRLSKLIWESPLLATVRGDLEKAGFTVERAERYFTPLDPVKNLLDQSVTQKVALGYSVYDQVVGEEKFLDLINKFKFERVITYKAGHLNILRVPKLAIDLNQYFHRMAQRELSDECG
jgi:pimeloyl-ACP methyl ester carboxylesterase